MVQGYHKQVGMYVCIIIRLASYMVGIFLVVSNGTIMFFRYVLRDITLYTESDIILNICSPMYVILI